MSRDRGSCLAKCGVSGDDIFNSPHGVLSLGKRRQRFQASARLKIIVGPRYDNAESAPTTSTALLNLSALENHDLLYVTITLKARLTTSTHFELLSIDESSLLSIVVFNFTVVLKTKIRLKFELEFQSLYNAMPSAVSPELPQWERPAKTRADLDWADISVVDISSFDEPGGRDKLAEELQHAVR
jgi:hypothetical protein